VKETIRIGKSFLVKRKERKTKRRTFHSTLSRPLLPMITLSQSLTNDQNKDSQKGLPIGQSRDPRNPPSFQTNPTLEESPKRRSRNHIDQAIQMEETEERAVIIVIVRVREDEGQKCEEDQILKGTIVVVHNHDLIPRIGSFPYRPQTIRI